MTTRPSFSVTKALSAAVASLPAAWGGAWLVLLLLWGTAVYAPIMLHGWHMGWHALLVMVALGILKLMTTGALYRIALFGKDAKKEGLGIGGLQLAWPELRLVAAGIIVGLFVLVIIAAILIVFAMAFNMSGMGARYDNTLLALRAVFTEHDTLGDWIVIGYLVAACLFMAFVSLKFSLLHAANIAEHRLVTLNALGLSTGQVGKLFVGILALMLPFLAIVAGLHHLFGAEIRLADAMPYPWMNQRMGLALHGGLLVLNIGVLTPLLAGFFASAYRQITATRAV